MAIEHSQLKFAKSETTGEIIGFVSRHSKTKKLRGVRENSSFGKKICVLSEDMKGKVFPNILYNVELKAMHQGNGYVVISAEPVQFKALVETIIVPKAVYQVSVTFGNKVVYFDPKDGKTPSSNTLGGALKVLNERYDIADKEEVVEQFKKQPAALIRRLEQDGYLVPRQLELFP